MESNTTLKFNNVRGISLAALFLGIGSVIVLMASIALGTLVESIGITMFYGLIIPLGLAAFICGLIARKGITKEKSVDRRFAMLGMVLGAVVLGLLLILITTIFVIFIPGLGAH